MTAESIYQVFWIFLSYVFLGWCTEMIFRAVLVRKSINRGFLNGPVRPIYGFGVLAAALCLAPLGESLPWLFAGTAVLTLSVEFIKGFIIKALKRKKTIAIMESENKDNSVRRKGFFSSRPDGPNKVSLTADTPKSVYQNAPLILYRDTVAMVIDLLEARDEYTAGHSRRVSELTRRFCKVLDLPPLEAEMLNMAATIHDIGKIGIPDAILNKHDTLTEEEWKQMRRHPEIGADIILKAGRLDHVARIVRHHHEHWDGSGYPDGLKGSEIPHGARIVAVCDAVDSMMLARVYRGALTTKECRAEVQASSASMFSPRLAETFLEHWDYIVGDLYENGKTVSI